MTLSLSAAIVVVVVVVVFVSVTGMTRRHLSPRSPCSEVTIYGLKTADCMNQNLVSVPQSLDGDLKTLNLHDNLLTSLEIDSFAVYPALQNLYLVRNRLDRIAPDAFRRLQNLQILDLEGNKLKSVPGPSFQHLPSVRFLSLKSNAIVYVTNGDLAHLASVEVLNLENCWLSRIEARAFANLTHLYELNVVNNELRGMSAEVEQTIAPSVRVLRLHSNPWQCDCRLRWLRRTVDRVPNWDFGGSNTPVCNAPDLLRGVTWKQLTPDQFACPTTILAGNATTIRELPVGANTTIECVALGDPQPSVTWMKGTRHVSDRLVTQDTVHPDSHHHHSSGTLVRSVVTLRDVTEADSSDYKCVAVNAAGRSEVTYKVWVSGGGGGAGGDGKTGSPALGSGVWSMTLGPEMILGVIIGSGVLVCILLFCVTIFVIRRRGASNRNSDPRKKKKPDGDPEKIPVNEAGIGRVPNPPPPPPPPPSSSSAHLPPTGSGSSSNNSLGNASTTDPSDSSPTTPGTPRDWTQRNHAAPDPQPRPTDTAPRVENILPSSSAKEPPRHHHSSSSRKESGGGGKAVESVRSEPPHGTTTDPANPSSGDGHFEGSTPDLLSDKHLIINPRAEGQRTKVSPNIPPISAVESSFRNPPKTSSSPPRPETRTRSPHRNEDRFHGGEVAPAERKGSKTIPRKPPPTIEISKSDALQATTSGTKPATTTCDNPLCLRERPSGSPGAAPAAPQPPASAPVCSHRLAMRNQLTSGNEARISIRTNPQRYRIPPQNPFNQATSQRCSAGRGASRRAVGRGEEDGGGFDPRRGARFSAIPAFATLSRRSTEGRMVWAARGGGGVGQDDGFRIRTNRNSTGNGSVVIPASGRHQLHWRSSSTQLEAEEELDFDDDDEESPLRRRRQTFSSVSLNEILSPPFGGVSDAYATATSRRRRPPASRHAPAASVAGWKGRRNAEDEQCTTAV